jgi:hypothetical protein
MPSREELNGVDNITGQDSPWGFDFNGVQHHDRNTFFTVAFRIVHWENRNCMNMSMSDRNIALLDICIVI